MDPSDANKFDDRLYIGNSRAASNLDWLKHQGITHVINCAGEIPNFFPKELHYLHLTLKDDPINEDLFKVLEPTHQYISKILKRDGTKVYIHCHMGISRSASVALHHLMRSKNMGYDLALELLQSKRGIVRPNKNYEKHLRDISTYLGHAGGKQEYGK